MGGKKIVSDKSKVHPLSTLEQQNYIILLGDLWKTFEEIYTTYVPRLENPLRKRNAAGTRFTSISSLQDNAL